MKLLPVVPLVRLGLVLLSGSTALSLHGQSPSVAPPPGSLTVTRDGRQSILTPADLAKLPHRDVRVIAEGATDSATVSGVNLWDILQAAGAPPTEASGRQRAVMYVRLKGGDGQNAVLALVEVDPGFSRRTVLVADHRNGKLLDESEGPWRVIIPDDQRHARWIRGLVGVEIVTLRP
jgi:Oxidoreductase molybdopterin binding domain